jgi:hypothetical protein
MDTSILRASRTYRPVEQRMNLRPIDSAEVETVASRLNMIANPSDLCWYIGLDDITRRSHLGYGHAQRKLT